MFRRGTNAMPPQNQPPNISPYSAELAKFSICHIITMTCDNQTICLFYFEDESRTVLRLKAVGLQKQGCWTAHSLFAGPSLKCL